MNKRAFGVGSRVQFHSAKRNQTLVGTVEKVAIKFVTVNTGTGRWKVPANMLQATGA
jgi:small-conductance mechanosensitive channel